MGSNFNDPIVAVATAMGNSGIGIIRLSGADASLKKIVSAVTRGCGFSARTFSLKKIYDQKGDVIDRALVLYFPAPASYTGETVIEIQAHGGQVVLTWIVDLLLAAGKKEGLRIANPGEFTERAFLNGKLSLNEAEAVADLIDASSRSAVKAASLSLNGEFAQKISVLDDELVRLRMEVEAILDFPEEEIDFIDEYKCKERTDALLSNLADILDTAEQGQSLKNGFRVAIVGQTNVGKSSILNKLVGEDVAIVSEFEGTTRDKIQSQIHLNGIPFFVTDTAGIRETNDKVELIGIDRAKAEIAKADIILHIVDARQNQKSAEDQKMLTLIESLTNREIPVITVFNKSDLCACLPSVSRETEIITSAKTGLGIPQLRELLLKVCGWKNKDSVFIARQRHINSLKGSLEHLTEARSLINNPALPLELFAEELKLAGENLGEIVGKTVSEDILDMIFKGFCIGK